MKRGLGLEEVVSAARKATGVRGAGFVDTPNQRIGLRSEGQAVDSQAVARTVVTSTGAPWWIASVYMHDPVRRLIAHGVRPWICPKAKFHMLTLHDMDHFTRRRGDAFLRRVEREFRSF